MEIYMRSEKLQKAINNIDDDLITEADVKPATARKTVLKWASGAVAACLVAVCAVFAFPMLNRTAAPVPMEEVDGEVPDGNKSGDAEAAVTGSTIEIEIAPATTANETPKTTAGENVAVTTASNTVPVVTTTEYVPVMTTAADDVPAVTENIPVTTTAATVPEGVLAERYKYAIDGGKYAAYEPGRVIDASLAGNKLDDVTVSAGWVYVLDGETWVNNEHGKAEIFEITGVSPDTAVALKFTDKLEAVRNDMFYVLLNPAADLTTVQEYVIPNVDPFAAEEPDAW